LSARRVVVSFAASMPAPACGACVTIAGGHTRAQLPEQVLLPP
jgi:hypothetical protein